MADNKVSFEITANTKPAGKALLDLSKLINKAITVDIKGQDKGVIAQQKEYKKLATEVNNAFKEINKLNKADKDAGVKAGLPFNQYLANEKKIETLKSQLDNTTDLKERKQINAEISKYKSANARMDDYARQVLRQILGTEQKIVSDEQSIFGIKTAQVSQSKKISDDTKKSTENESELNKTVKETSAGLEKQAKDAKEAGDAFTKTTKENSDAQAKRIDEARAKITSLSAEIDNILSRNFGGPDKFTFADFDSAKQDLTELRDAIKLLDIPDEFKDDYNRIVEALNKIALGERMLRKEQAEAGKNPIIPAEQVEDEAARVEQKIYEVSQQANKALTQLRTSGALTFGDLKGREQELKGVIKAIEQLGVPKELVPQYNALKLELGSTTASMRELEKQGVSSTDDLAFSVAKLVEQYNQLYLLVEKGQSTPADWEQLQETKKLLNEVTSLNFKDPDALPAELSLIIKELQEGFTKIRDLMKSGNFSDKTKELSTSLFNALEQAKIAYADMKREVKEPLPADKLREFHTAMQSVLDITDRVSQKMRFDTNAVSIAELIRRLNELNQAKKTLEDFGLPSEMDHRYTQLIQMIAQTNAQLSEEKKKMQEVSEASTKAGNDGSTAQAKIKSSASKTVSPLKRIGNEINFVKSGFSGLSKTADKVKSSFNNMAKNMRSNFKHMITNLTKYVLGFRSLFFLVRRLRKYLGEGIKNLAQFEDGANPVNEAITDMLSSLLYLKNAWAAAFAPIITFVRPILVSLIDGLAQVGNAVARVLSFLLGQEIVFNAVRVSAEDYAGGLDDVGGSAGGAADKVKKLTDRLAAFDDLNVLGKDNDNDGTGSGGGGGSADAYTPDPDEMFKVVDTDMLENMYVSLILSKLKQSWENADFSWLGETLKNKIIEGLTWLDSNWGEVQTVADKIGHSLGSFLVGLLGDPTTWELFGKNIGEAFNTITISIAAFLDELDKIPFGENAGKSVNEFLQTTDWALAGENIGGVINGIITNINDFINTLDADKVASAISDFVEGIDIPQIVANLDELVFNATKLLVNIISGVVVNSGEKFGDALINWVNDGVQVAYLDKNGVVVKFGFALQTDWTEQPVVALFERIAHAISARILTNTWRISVLFGLDWDYGEFLDSTYKAFDDTHIFDWCDAIDEAIYKTGDLITGWDVAGSTAKEFDETVAHSAGGFSHYTDTVVETNTTVNEFMNSATDLKNTVTGLTDANNGATSSVYNLGVASQQATDTMVTGFTDANTTVSAFNPTVNEASATMTEYGTNVGMVIEQSNTDLTNSANTMTSWNDTVTSSVDGTTASWDELGNTVSVNGGVYINTVSDLETETGNVQLSVTGDFTNMAEGISESTNSMSDTLNTTWVTLGADVPDNVTQMTNAILEQFNLLQTDTETIWENIKTIISNDIQDARVQATTEASTLNVNLYNLFLKTKQEGTQQFDSLKDNIVSAFEDMASSVKSPMNSFLSSVESMVNHATDALNGLIDNVNQCMDLGSEWLVSMDLPDIGTQSHMSHISIPRLAQGAVIPPNREFMAVLGDQSHGTNIEAPLDTIKQAVAEVLANNNNQEVIDLLQQLIRVVESKNLTIGDKEIGKANARYTNQQRMIRGTTF